VYIVFVLCACAINAFGVRLLPRINTVALVWSIIGAVVVMITVLACASGRYQTASFVFGDVENQTGWSDGVAWILGLLQSAFGL
jgi:choline transport protein